MMRRMIYLDNAATTKPYQEAVDAALTYMVENWGNPSGAYEFGQAAKSAVWKARCDIASHLNCEPEEIYFTSGGSESDTWAIRSIKKLSCGHIITTAVEHKAVLNALHSLEKEGFSTTYLQPDERGFVTARQVEEAIRPDTVLVTVMMVNNELGTMMPIKAIGQVCEKHGILFHTDAVQGFGHMGIDVKDMGISMLSASGHKFHGLKGCGFLYVRNHVIMPSLIYGGGQESGHRAGTENVPGIVAMGVAANLSYNNLEFKTNNMAALRDHMIERILNEIRGSNLNGSLVVRSANNVNVRFDGIRGDQLVILLDMNGVCCSTGSACNNGEPLPSHVLTAIGLTPEEANSSVRFTLTEDTTMEDIDLTVDYLKNCVDQLRMIANE